MARRGRDGGAAPSQGTKATWFAAASDVGRWLADCENDRDRSWRDARQSVWGLVAHGLRSHPKDTNLPAATDARHIVETSAPQNQNALAGDAKPSPSPENAASNASFTLTNPRETGGPVRFLLNGRESVLQPGETQRLNEGPWLIEFHRGGDFGEARYTLTPGAYRFRVTRSGWELLASSAPRS